MKSDSEQGMTLFNHQKGTGGGGEGGGDTQPRQLESTQVTRRRGAPVKSKIHNLLGMIAIEFKVRSIGRIPE